MESLHGSATAHWDHEPISPGRERLRRALIFIAPKRFRGSTESRPTGRLRETEIKLKGLGSLFSYLLAANLSLQGSMQSCCAMSIEGKCPECGTELESSSAECLCLKCLLQPRAPLDSAQTEAFPSHATVAQ